MSVRSDFTVSADQTPFYDYVAPLPAEDKKTLHWLTSLAVYLPYNPAGVLRAADVQNFIDQLEGMNDFSGLGIGFKRACMHFTQIVKDAIYYDGSKTICLRPHAHDKLLKGFLELHKAQKAVRLTDAGASHFAQLVRSRQTYWDMQGSGVGPISYEPGNYR